MILLITIIHIAVCVFLVGIVLVQHGKGADIGATFGGGGQSLFGTEGPVTLLNKVTTVGAIIFMSTSIFLAYNSAHRTSGSLMENAAPTAPVQQQSRPAPQSVPQNIPMPAQKTLDSSEEMASPEKAAPPTATKSAPATSSKTAPAQETPTPK